MGKPCQASGGRSGGRLSPCIRAAALAAGVFSATAVAAAQDLGGIEPAPQYSRGYNTAVRERPHPEWAPIDMQLGGFTLQPQIALTSIYTDNEKYAAANPRSDVYFRIQPAVSLGSNWSRNGLGLQAYVAQTEYARFSEDDSTEYGVTGSGRLDVTRDTSFDLKGGDQHLVLSREDPDVPVDSRGPAMFDRQDGQATLTKTFPRFQVQAIAAVRNETYGAVGAPGGGVYDFRARNGLYDSVSGRLSYGLSPAVAVFAGALYDAAAHPRFAGLKQDESGANLVGGVNFDLSKLARGEVAVGYLYQSYDTPGTKPDSGFAFSANLQYFPTQLTTVTLAGQRATAPVNVAGSAGGIALQGSVTVDHELLRNLIVSANLNGSRTQYRNFLVQSVFTNRTDTQYGGGVSATYLMNRLVSLELAYGYADVRSSDALRRSFRDNHLSLTLRLVR